MCFLVRGAFYAVALPLWEGYDEWSHFAVVQRIAVFHEPLVSRYSKITKEIDESLKIAPVPWWYMYAVAAAEVTLCIAGLRAISPSLWRDFIAVAGVFLFTMLDLYTVHFVAIPYYTGILAHRADGSLAAFHFNSLQNVGVLELLRRLTLFKTQIVTVPSVTALWIAYLVATASPLFLYCLYQTRQRISRRDSSRIHK